MKLLTGSFSDFEKTFIQCIVYNYEMLKEYKDEASLKAAGKVMTKGKDYGEYLDGLLVLLVVTQERLLTPYASGGRW